MSNVKWTDVASIIVGISMPIVIFISATNIEESQQLDAQVLRETQIKLEMDTRTLSRLQGLDDKVTAAISDKSKLDKAKNITDPKNYQYNYVNGNEDILPLVLIILNGYEELCAGANLGLYSLEVIKALRIDALKATFSDYSQFITTWRQAPLAQHAWNECKILIESNE